MKTMHITASALAIAALSTGAAVARDHIQITGSSTVLPYATIVAEAFGENFDFPSPVVGRKRSERRPQPRPATIAVSEKVVTASIEEARMVRMLSTESLPIFRLNS